MRETKIKKNKQNGITLIALVISIIIMLILVSVSISMAVNGGLFNYAGKAVGDTQNEIDKEKELANSGVEVDGKVYNSISEYIEGVAPNPDEKFSEIYKDNKTITEKVDGKTYTAVIPKGFAVGTSTGINTIAGGLVITDKVNSEGQSTGNEFVWIPVVYEEEGDNDNDGYDDGFKKAFYRSGWTDGENGGTRVELSSGYKEPYESGYSDGKGTEEIKDYNEMLKSVYENKGFYIGRYEAGSTVARTDKANGTTTMVVKRDAYPYVYVGWGLTVSDYTSNVIWQGKDQGLGALALSKAMYANKDVGVTSTLCYSIQWDTMLDFIKDNDHSVINSTTWGNCRDNTWVITRKTAMYSEKFGEKWITVGDTAKEKISSGMVLLTTGASDDFSAKNIYDVAGNITEWTCEAGLWDEGGEIAPRKDLSW